MNNYLRSKNCLIFCLAIFIASFTPDPGQSYTTTIYEGCERGNGVEKSVTRQVPMFNILELSGAFQVNVVNSSTNNQVKITGDENLLPIIATTTQGNKLVIYPEKSICTEIEIKLDISVGNLAALVSSGSDNVKVSDLNSRKFSLLMSGASDVELSGQTHVFDAEISGAGDLESRGLKSGTTILNISGTGTANVHASESLQVEVVGVADVNYSGNPKEVIKDILGVGSVNKLD